MTFRIVVQNRRNPRHDEWEAASEHEAREVAQAQSDCDGQRTWKFHVYDGDRRVTFYEGGREGAKSIGRRRPPKPPPVVRLGVTYSIAMYTRFGVHVGDEPMPSEAAALEFARTKWKGRGFRQMDFHIYEAFPSGQRHLLARYRRGRRLTR